MLIVLYPIVNDLADKSDKNKGIDNLLKEAEKVNSNLDTDSDGLLDRVEIVLGISQNISDTDNDGYSDYYKWYEN
ncbi:MAG: hypothetical protein KAS01_00940 [Candidatus Pacebacteria bacterium]|nr:hypothetical protein [Candidatus Paceibacterota bacterium]